MMLMLIMMHVAPGAAEHARGASEAEVGVSVSHPDSRWRDQPTSQPGQHAATFDSCFMMLQQLSVIFISKNES